MNNINMGVGLYNTMNEISQCLCLPFRKKAPFYNYGSYISSFLMVTRVGRDLTTSSLDTISCLVA